ncbi:MAG: S24/S26 family peptidase [Bacteroidales bacterium]|jgi:signal peptidase I|nr:S24/S26 family peptidase [Bacteroidales bacterium]
MDNRKQSGEILQSVGYALLAEGKTISIRAHGYSMFPAIKPGTTILIEPLCIGGVLRPGEIIAVKRNHGLVIHRLARIIVKNGITAYIARGDSNTFEDHPVALDDIVGRITCAETGESPVADTGINTHPRYYTNRMRVIIAATVKRIGKYSRFRR